MILIGSSFFDKQGLLVFIIDKCLCYASVLLILFQSLQPCLICLAAKFCLLPFT